MSNLFFLDPSPELKDKTAAAAIVNNISADEEMAPLPVPSTNRGLINVVKDFKWTKTIRNDINIKQIPTLSLTEYYITQPAFISNLTNMAAVLPRAVKGFSSNIASNAAVKPYIDTIKSTIGNVENSDWYQDSVGENLKNPIVKKIKGTAADVGNFIKDFAGFNPGIPVGSAPYMKAYENIYGVIESKFKYRIPYFLQDWKSIKTIFDGDTPSSSGSSDETEKSKSSSGFLQNAMNLVMKPYDIAQAFGGKLSTGFAVDFAKSYKYGGEGSPDQTIEFILDNTYDSYHDREDIPSYQKNWELIFLLLYQNLPNKRNRLFFDPPVIYRAEVPGVFFYLYSYISELAVTALGNTQPRTVLLTTATEDYGDTKPIQTIIPEAFKIKIVLKSLLPETKNLFLNSYSTSVTTSSV